MASLRDIRSRIKSVQNTKQVTRAMKMVAAAKLRRAQERIFQTRPYAFKIRDLIVNLQRYASSDAHPLLETRDEVGATLFIIVTGDRGLAGAFNANVIKLAESTVGTDYAKARSRGDLYVLAVGRKASEHFGKRDYQMAARLEGLFDDLTFAEAQRVVDIAVEGFREGRWDEVKIVYNEFKNTISQNRIVEPLLPIPADRFLTPVMEEDLEGPLPGGEDDDRHRIDYIFEPSAEDILQALVPRYLAYQVWRILLESNAAEQGARMVAMDNATNNAEDLLEELKLKYNRARQDAITTEIIEITSGAEALEGQ